MSLSYLPGTASLLDELDKKLMVLLRDGRIHVKDEYGDIPLGVFVVRGENVVLLGEIEETEEVKGKLKQVTLKEILEKQAVQQAEKEETERLRAKAFKDRGLSYTTEAAYDDMY